MLALVGEIGELAEIFQWKKENESGDIGFSIKYLLKISRTKYTRKRTFRTGNWRCFLVSDATI